jgi:hypothetical protein
MSQIEPNALEGERVHADASHARLYSDGSPLRKARWTQMNATLRATQRHAIELHFATIYRNNLRHLGQNLEPNVTAYCKSRRIRDRQHGRTGFNRTVHDAELA